MREQSEPQPGWNGREDIPSITPETRGEKSSIILRFLHEHLPELALRIQHLLQWMGLQKDTAEKVYNVIEVASREELRSVDADSRAQNPIAIEEVPEFFVPPDPVTNPPEGSDSVGEKEKAFMGLNYIPRRELIWQVLKELGIDTEDCEHRRGKCPHGGIRTLPYELLVIQDLDKMILFCNEEWNITFVIHTTENAEVFAGMGKKELKAQQEIVSCLEWKSNTDAWKMSLQKYLLSSESLGNSFDKFLVNYFNVFDQNPRRLTTVDIEEECAQVREGAERRDLQNRLYAERWTANRAQALKKAKKGGAGRITEEQIKILNERGFEWGEERGKNIDFNEFVEAYFETFNEKPRSLRSADIEKLLQDVPEGEQEQARSALEWEARIAEKAKTIRRAQKGKAGVIAPEQIDILNERGFDWGRENPPRISFEEFLEAYFEIYGQRPKDSRRIKALCEELPENEDAQKQSLEFEGRIFTKAQNYRCKKRKGKLDPEIEAQLNERGFNWEKVNPREVFFEDFVIAFFEKFNGCPRYLEKRQIDRMCEGIENEKAREELREQLQWEMKIRRKADKIRLGEIHVSEKEKTELTSRGFDWENPPSLPVEQTEVRKPTYEESLP